MKEKDKGARLAELIMFSCKTMMMIRISASGMKMSVREATVRLTDQKFQ